MDTLEGLHTLKTVDLLDRMLGHDAWTTEQLLRIAGQLPDALLDQDCGFAHRTVRRTFVHMIYNEEAWTDLLRGHPIRNRDEQDIAGLLDRHGSATRDLRAAARAIADRHGWDDTWVDPTETPPVRRTFGGTILHIATHGMHHRAQVLQFLRQLGVSDLPEGDALSWEARCTGF